MDFYSAKRFAWRGLSMICSTVQESWIKGSDEVRGNRLQEEDGIQNARPEQQRFIHHMNEEHYNQFSCGSSLT